MNKKEEAREMLIRLRALMKTSWIQGAMAIDEKGYCVACDSTQATQFCLLGGVHRIGLNDRAWSSLISIIEKQDEKFTTIITFNDWPGITVSDILSVIDQAIILNEGEVI